MQTYSICEHFYSLQGEGYNVGKPAYFIRLSGCNVRCSFCDSIHSWDENAGEKRSAIEISEYVKKINAKNVVITGGEPLCQDLEELCKVLKSSVPKIRLWLETSGTETLSGIFDWVCLSPKKHCLPLPENYAKANELKIIIETTDDFVFAEKQARLVKPTCKLFLQAEWSVEKNISEDMIDYVLRYPKWRLSVQIHKMLNIR